MTQRTEQCCKECSGWEPALHECSCECHYAPNDTSVVEEWERRFFIQFESKEQLCCNGDYCRAHCADTQATELKDFIRNLLTSLSTQHKLEVEKAVREEREAVVRIAECYMNVVDFNNFCEELNEPELTLTETDQQARESERESKDSAYRERNMLVCALTKLFPAYLARHDENDESWERDWMWIVYIDLPTGQVSWHIHDSERGLFNHLEVKENNWDGHNTERKYQRLLALSTLSNPPSQV